MHRLTPFKKVASTESAATWFWHLVNGYTHSLLQAQNYEVFAKRSFQNNSICLDQNEMLSLKKIDSIIIVLFSVSLILLYVSFKYAYVLWWDVVLKFPKNECVVLGWWEWSAALSWPVQSVPLFTWQSAVTLDILRHGMFLCVYMYMLLYPYVSLYSFSVRPICKSLTTQSSMLFETW